MSSVLVGADVKLTFPFDINVNLDLKLLNIQFKYDRYSKKYEEQFLGEAKLTLSKDVKLYEKRWTLSYFIQ